MAQSTTNLGKIHVFPSETLYNQFKDIIADNDLAFLKDDGAYIVAALLEQNGYVKFSNGLILQWGTTQNAVIFPLKFTQFVRVFCTTHCPENSYSSYAMNASVLTLTGFKMRTTSNPTSNEVCAWLAVGIEPPKASQ